MITKTHNEAKAKILVADNDLNILASIRESLEKYGYEKIETAGNGKKAVQLVKDCCPDLVMLDINLNGGLNGIKTAERILEAADIPIIFITSFSSDATLRKTKQIEPYGYLLKPIDNQVMYSTIEMALNRFLLEKQLRESEAKLTALFECTRDAIGVSKDGIHVYANPAYLKLFGFKNHDQLVGSSILDCIEENHREQIIQYVQQRSHGVEVPLVYKTLGRKRDGSEFDFEINVSTYKLNGETYTVANTHDITERKQADEKLKDSEYFFKESQHAASVGSYTTNFITGTWVSSEVLDQIFGIDENYDRSVKGWLELIHPDDHEMMNSYLINEVIANKKTFDKDYRIVRNSDRVTRWVHGFGRVNFDAGGKITSMIGTILDITDKKKVEESLIESESRFRNLYENAPIGLYRTTPDGKIVLANKALYKMLGYSSFEELSKIDINKTGYESPDQRILFIELIERNGEVRDLEAKWKRCDGSTLIVRESAKIIKDECNNTIYYDGTVEDITERKLIEETQMFLLHSFSNGVNGDFFISLAGYLAKCLEMDYVCIDKLNEDNLAAKTLAIYYNDKFEDNVEYTLKDTPCGDVVGKTICCFPEKVRHLFPNDIVLQEMKAESYIGTTLWSSDHRPIGLIAVIGRKTLENQHLAETILNLVAIRSSSELERRQAETAILEKEIQYRALADSGIALIWTAGLDKLCNYFNEPWLKFTGRTLEQEIGNGWAEGVHPDDFDYCLKTYLEAFDKREPFDMEYRLRHVSGEYKWLRDMGIPNYNAAGKFIGYIGHCFDITDRKQDELLIKKSEEKFYKAFETSPEAISISSMEDGTYVDVNNVFLKTTGYSREELIGHKSTELKFWVEKDGRQKFITELSNKGSVKNFEAQYRMKDGKIKDFWVSSEIIELDGKHCSLNFILDVTERKKAEEALIESELRFKQVAENAKEWIWEVDKNGLYTYASRVSKELLGYNPDEIVGKKYFYDLFVEKDKEELKALTFEAFARKEQFTGLINVNKHKDGSDIILSTSGVPILNNDGDLVGYRGVDVDITESKQMQDVLLKSKRQYDSLVSNIPVGVYLLLSKTNKSYTFKYVSPKMEEILGINSKSIMADSKVAFQSIHPDDIGELTKLNEEHFQSPRLFNWQGRAIVNGNIIWIHIASFPEPLEDGNVLWHGVISNITESKLAEEKLKSSFSLLNATLESTADGILVVDSTGKINLFNQRFIEMWKIPKELLTIKDDKLLLEHLITFVEKPEEFISNLNELYLKPDESSFDVLNLSEERTFERYSRPQKIGDAIVGRVWSFRDITERRRARKELEEYQAHLEELVKIRTEELNEVNSELIKKIEKENEFKLILQQSLEKEKELNEMKSQFISTASHEFRTPLTSILSSAGLIKKYSKQWGDDKKNEHYDRIQNSVTYLTKLLDDVLTINRVESGKIKLTPESIDLKEFVQGCIDESKNLSENHQIYLNYGGPQSIYPLDSKLLKFIFNNLLSNAIKYSPNGGRVEVKISSNHNYLRIEVGDEGIGIHNTETSKVFDPFYRSKEAENISGNGLGLSIVKRAVDLHRGEIKVKSELDKGTTFLVEIPIKTN
jgi:PAS domain S-box-containing protein